MTTSRDIVARLPITYRQLDLWTTKGYLGSDKSTGSGKSRQYSGYEVKLLERIVAFVGAGVRPEVAAAIARGDVAATRKIVSAMNMIDGGSNA